MKNSIILAVAVLMVSVNAYAGEDRETEVSTVFNANGAHTHTYNRSKDTHTTEKNTEELEVELGVRLEKAARLGEETWLSLSGGKDMYNTNSDLSFQEGNFYVKAEIVNHHEFIDLRKFINIFNPFKWFK